MLRLLVILTYLLIYESSALAQRVILTWGDPNPTPGQNNGEDGTRIERSATRTGSFVVVGSVAPNVTTYIENGLTIGSNVCYRVKAFNGAGESAPTPIVCVTVRALPSDEHLTLSGSSNAQ